MAKRKRDKRIPPEECAGCGLERPLEANGHHAPLPLPWEIHGGSWRLSYQITCSKECRESLEWEVERP